MNMQQSSEQIRQDDVLKVHVLFDSDASARCAEELIRRVCQTEILEITLLRLNEHLLSRRGDDSARRASDVDVLIVSMQTDFDPPLFAKAWLARWVHFRHLDREGALVALVVNEVVPRESNSHLAAHLETVAVVGGLDFFYGCARNYGGSYRIDSSSLRAVVARRLPDGELQPTERWGINE
jgi:hypothetical protein